MRSPGQRDLVSCMLAPMRCPVLAYAIWYPAASGTEMWGVISCYVRMKESRGSMEQSRGNTQESRESMQESRGSMQESRGSMRVTWEHARVTWEPPACEQDERPRACASPREKSS
eukprot:308115-Rhodomonas_salina.3